MPPPSLTVIEDTLDVTIPVAVFMVMVSPVFDDATQVSASVFFDKYNVAVHSVLFAHMSLTRNQGVSSLV